MWLDPIAALDQSALSEALRQSHWLYLLISAGHITGLALLFGAIVPLDLKLLGAWPSVPARLIARVLVPAAKGGLVLAIASGLLLFAAHPARYAVLGVFQLKMLLVMVGAVNALLLDRSVAWDGLMREAGEDQPAGRVRRAAGLSLAIWCAVLLAGRMIGFAD